MAARNQLPTLLARLPRDGLNSIVYQSRWARKGLPVPSSPASTSTACYWDVQKVQMLPVTESGKVSAKAFGVFYWKGKRVTPENTLEPIKGGLKYDWSAAGLPDSLAHTKKQVEAIDDVAA